MCGMHTPQQQTDTYVGTCPSNPPLSLVQVRTFLNTYNSLYIQFGHALLEQQQEFCGQPADMHGPLPTATHQ
jgi:hypothetical protein